MHGKNGSNLIIIEKGLLTPYMLDDRTVWELGRPSKGKVPDIKLHSTTVSRKHGKFQNMDGVWFYLDYNGKNGTVYNQKHITPGLNGRVKPVMLKDGDVFIFGGGEEEVINWKTVWGLYITRDFGETWRVVDSKVYSQVQFQSGDSTTTFSSPHKGTVVKREDGIGIYMGDLTYLVGDMEFSGQ